MDEARLYRSFGRRVSARRSALQLTQAQLASRVGFSRASIANIERGQQKLPLHQVYRLSEALGLHDVRELLPPMLADEAAPQAPSISITEPREGLNSEERRQVEQFYNDTDATGS